MTVVKVENLTHIFSQERGRPSRTALSDLSFTIEQGEIFGLLGPNGGGKTTLFRILSTLIPPTQGTALIFDNDVKKFPQNVRQKIGVVFQNPSLDKKLTLLENIQHQGHLYGLTGDELRERTEETLNRLSLTSRADDLVETLSGGLQRRVEIAKGLLHKPELLILDEPSTGLDPGARREMWDYLLELREQGITILLTTHLMEEGDKCTRLLILNQGQRVALDSPDDLKKRIGGDVIHIQTHKTADLAEKIKMKFKLSPTIVDQSLRIEIQNGHQFIPQLVEAFPGFIDAVHLGKPTLEDVFVKETGHVYSAEGAAA